MKDQLVEEIRIAATPKLVFEAWTSEQITAWWRNADFSTTKWEGEVRDGGNWRVCFEDRSGNQFVALGQYYRAEPASYLCFSWKPDWDPDPPTTIALEFRSFLGGTVLRLTQINLSNIAAYERNKRAWAATLLMLRQYLQDRARAQR